MLGTLEPTPPSASPATRFDALFQRHYAELFGLAARVLGDRGAAEDTLQEVFLKLTSAPVLARPDAEVAAWLRRVCLNLSFNSQRGRRRAEARLALVGRLEAGEVDAASPDQAILRREQQAAVRSALRRLPERQRECLLLRHAGYSYAEIAAALEIAIGSVGVLLARAEQAFRDTYQEEPHADTLHPLP